MQLQVLSHFFRCHNLCQNRFSCVFIIYKVWRGAGRAEEDSIPKAAWRPQPDESSRPSGNGLSGLSKQPRGSGGTRNPAPPSRMNQMGQLLQNRFASCPSRRGCNQRFW